ncbi:hypothetical protein EVAR_48744_1 [Eumeta japonica]|uniref:Uncharacterized protein n=1 Tax=Eumeta variegata TaxID=151549 RepID=A0A4C1YJB0_EUMVA|nr:hypothetical protein EVAR_48744_1 [Eumeta japonica]
MRQRAGVLSSRPALVWSSSDRRGPRSIGSTRIIVPRCPGRRPAVRSVVGGGASDTSASGSRGAVPVHSALARVVTKYAGGPGAARSVAARVFGSTHAHDGLRWPLVASGVPDGLCRRCMRWLYSHSGRRDDPGELGPVPLRHAEAPRAAAGSQLPPACSKETPPPEGRAAPSACARSLGGIQLAERRLDRVTPRPPQRTLLHPLTI